MNNIPSSDPEPSTSLIDDSAAGTLSPDSSTAENSESQIQDSLRPPRSRRGSVARLPKELRDQINQKLDDGFSYNVICDHLRAEGIELSQHAIGRWKKGGYQDYLRERRLLEQSRLRYELTLDLAPPGTQDSKCPASAISSALEVDPPQAEGVRIFRLSKRTLSECGLFHAGSRASRTP